MKPPKTDNCELCKREIRLTFHHLVPKKYHENRIIHSKFKVEDLIHYGSWLCNDCHKQVHKLISLKELATDYYTIEKLMKHKEIEKFVKWASRQTKKIKG